MDYTGTGNTLNARHPQRAAADHGLAALLGQRDATSTASASTSRQRAGARALRRRPPERLLRHHPPGPDPVAGQADRRAVGRRPGRLPGRQLPGPVERVERHLPRRRARLLARRRSSVGEFASRFTGSSDLYESDGRQPFASINFVTAHDGFTLRDLVVLQREAQRGQRRGQPRRHRRQPLVELRRRGRDRRSRRSTRCAARQQRNFLATLFLSQGVPMLLGGDELGRTQHGNNNA